MSRERRAKLAAETDRIIASGGWVDLRAAIDRSVAATRLATEEDVRSLAAGAGDRRLAVELTNRTTLEAAASAASKGLAATALVFASARRPGGGYRSGAEAQEESLARSSALTASQSARPAFYEANQAAGNALYRDAMIVSPAVPIFRDDHGVLLERPHAAGFVTAAAPNVGALKDRAERAQVESALLRRMRAVIALAATSGVRRLILGAWGCGVFRNDPALVARLWREAPSAAPPAALDAGVEMAVFDPKRGEIWRAFEAEFGG